MLTTSGLKGGEILAEKIRNRIEQSPLKSGDLILSITSSFGVAQLEPMDAGLGDILARVDKALYAAKDSGRNQVSTLDLGEEILGSKVGVHGVS